VLNQSKPVNMNQINESRTVTITTVTTTTTVETITRVETINDTNVVSVIKEEETSTINSVVTEEEHPSIEVAMLEDTKYKVKIENVVEVLKVVEAIHEEAVTGTQGGTVFIGNKRPLLLTNLKGKQFKHRIQTDTIYSLLTFSHLYDQYPFYFVATDFRDSLRSLVELGEAELEVPSEHLDIYMKLKIAYRAEELVEALEAKKKRKKKS
jgi:hypothetical protein